MTLDPHTDGAAVIGLERVSKTYAGPPVVDAVVEVSLAVSTGELTALVGPSGSGKSTLLHLMGTLERPSRGTIRLVGRDLTDLDDVELSALRARHIGFVFQHFALLGSLSALENVETALLYQGIGRDRRRRLAQRALTLVGLDRRGDHRPAQLSGGEQQRVAIARALAGSPSIILADEPTGNLDSAAGASILDLLTELNRIGTTIAVVTHDRAIADRAARCIEMCDGRIVTDTDRSRSSA